jgi:hypothetical protein
MRVRHLALYGVALAAVMALSCHDRAPGSIQASVVGVQWGGSCASESTSGTTCSVIRTVSITVEEVGGRDVSLQSVSGVLWDTRAMQDMRAQPAALSSADVRQAAGSNVVPSHGQLVIPYELEFTVVWPRIMGPLEVRIHVRGRDDSNNVIEADCQSF